MGWYGAAMVNRYDTIIVGQGLAGTTLAWKLLDKGQRILVIDAGDDTGASAVAAGLMTPVTGKRMVCSPSFEEEWQTAVSFYRQIESRLAVPLLTEEPMIRLFDREEDRQAYLNRSDVTGRVKALPWEGQVESDGESKLGVQITPAGRLTVGRYLDVSRLAFEQMGSYRTANLSLEEDIITGDRFSVPRLNVEATSIVLCQGAEGNSLFSNVPNNPAKGEIHKVRLEKMAVDQVVHRSIWLAPDKADRSSEGTFDKWLVGATYEWQDFNRAPTAKAAAELQRKLAKLVDQRPEVQQVLVGIRPTMKDRQPVLGQHPVCKGLWIFNGLGSKGTLKSPLMADRLVAAMIDGHDIPVDISYQRLLAAATGTQPLTTVAQQKISETISEGDLAVDGTVGRGFDTAFLSEKVGETGVVIGFDLQREALQATAHRLKAIGASNVDLLHQGHETAGDVLQGREVGAAMFNLGYLPRSDKQLTTKSDTTLIAVAAVFEALSVGRRMTLLCYRGHEGGPEEYEAVGEWVSRLCGAEVERIESPVAKSTSPVLFVVTKQDNSD